MDLNQFKLRPGEKPMDVLKPDCGFLSIFKKVGVIGDSLSSGESESNETGKTGYHDFYEYSWPAYLAHVTGSEYHNYSRGGMTAEEFYNRWADQFGYWEKRQAYFVFLGSNDLFTFPRPVGKAEDVDVLHPENNDETYIGYMGRILSKCKRMEPDAFLFVSGPLKKDDPERDKVCDEAYVELRKLCAKYTRCYFLELSKYGLVYNDELKKDFVMGGHPNPMGYIALALCIGNYVDYIIRSDFHAFQEVALIGTPYKF